MPVEQRVGQLFMIGVSTSGLDKTTRQAIRDHHIGSAVLLGNSGAGRGSITQITTELSSLGDILTAVDQEGGSVQRLQGPGFSGIPTAQRQGGYPDGELRANAKTWGEELAAAGVRYNLAPVADVVPGAKQRSNAPVGQLDRNFGNDVPTVSASVTEFIEGSHGAGVLTSLKHFPGLGEVTVNTDFRVAIDQNITADHPYLESFRAGIEAGADSVMVSSAIFKQIDPDQEGVFSQRIIEGMLRQDLDFDKVVISDDLGMAAAVSNIPPGERATRFFAAGGDLLINADPSMMPTMAEATIAWAAIDPANAERVTQSATRVLELKQSAGLPSCS
jgi:glycoside hydrolase family 3 domain protein